MVESQVTYVIGATRTLEQRGARVFDVREEADTRYDEARQHSMVDTVVTAGGCKSWYLYGTGRNPTLWPPWSWRYRLDTRRFDWRTRDQCSAENRSRWLTTTSP